VLLAGSSTEYGRTADLWPGPISETAAFDPVSPYGVSKVATELIGRQYFHSFGIPVITARLFIHVGTGATESLALQEFARQVAMIERGLLPPVIRHGNLETARDTTDVRDSAATIIKLAEIGVPGESYNVGSGISTSTSELLKMVVDQSQVKVRTELEESRLRVYDEKKLVADNSKLRLLTGWVPNPNMNRTIRDILDYWRLTVVDTLNINANLFSFKDTRKYVFSYNWH
jgi:nucleoside-diphosphate-sugar epimerase